MIYRDASHRKYIGQQPCIICGDDTTTECAHLKFSCAALGKPTTGSQAKADDYWTVPLCGRHHREEQKLREPKFWAKYGWELYDIGVAGLRLFSMSRTGD